MELLHKPGESIAHNQVKRSGSDLPMNEKLLTVCLLRSKSRKHRFGLFFYAAEAQVASRGDNSFSEDEQSWSFRRLVLGKSNLWLGARSPAIGLQVHKNAG